MRAREEKQREKKARQRQLCGCFKTEKQPVCGANPSSATPKYCPAPPLAEFAPEPEETVEIEDPDVPLAELPQTGLHMAHLLLAAIGAALSALGLALGIRARRPRKERID